MTLYLALVLALLLGTSEQQLNSTSVKEALVCPSPFTPVGDQCLFVDILTTGTWQDMRDYCQGLGGDLVVLHDANLLADLIVYIHGNGWPYKYYWVGATDAGHEGEWLWVDGSPVRMGAPFWAGYGCENNIMPTGGTDQNCAAMDNALHLYLNDVSCTGSSDRHPICEL